MSTTPTTTETAEERPAGVADTPTGRPGQRSRRVAAGVFVVLVALPGLIYALGGRAAEIDNRAATEPPDVERVAALDDEALGQLEDHLAESVPGRELAVRANAWTQLHVLGRSPNPEVVLGAEDWLYLRSTLEVPCAWADAVGDIRVEMERAATLVESTGRRWVTAVAPDKAVLYPGNVPDDVDLACFEAFSSAIQEELEDAPPTGYVPTWDALRADRDASEEPTYHVHDTHWTDAGSLPFVLALVDAIDPALTVDVTVTPIAGLERTGDLTKLYGLPSERPAPAVRVDRPGIEPHVAAGNTLELIPDDVHPEYAQLQTTTGTGSPVVEGRTVLWHDSFGEIALPHLEPFFRHLVGVRRRPIARPWVSDIVSASGTVIHETVQRALVPRWTEGHIVGQLAWALRDDLPTARSEPGEDGWIPVDPESFSIVAVPVDALAPELHGTPLRLQLLGDDGGPLIEQHDFDTDTPRVFDLSRHPETAYVRLATRDGSAVDVSHVLQISDVAAIR